MADPLGLLEAPTTPGPEGGADPLGLLPEPSLTDKALSAAKESITGLPRAAVGLAESFGKGVNVGGLAVARGFDEIATFISKKTGLPKGGIIENAAKEYQENIDFWDKKIAENGADGLTQLMGEAAGGAVPGITEFAMGPAYYGIKGMAEASNKGESPVAGAAKGAGERYLTGHVLDALNMLKMVYRVPAMAGVGAVQAAAEGGSIPQGAGTMALYGMMGPTEGMGLGDVVKDLARSPKDRAADIMARAKNRLAATTPPTEQEAPVSTLADVEPPASPDPLNLGLAQPGEHPLTAASEPPAGEAPPEGAGSQSAAEEDGKGAPSKLLPIEQHQAIIAKKTTEMTPEERSYALTHDKLTGLPNQKALEELPEKPNLVLLDIDGFKQINDQFGHDAGDQYLRAIRTAMDENGIDWFHRLHGDEHAFYADNQDDALSKLRQLDTVLKDVTIKGTDTRTGEVYTLDGVGYSDGIGEGKSFDEKFKSADKSLYATKDFRTEFGQRVPGNLPAEVHLTPEGQGRGPQAPEGGGPLQGQTGQVTPHPEKDLIEQAAYAMSEKKRYGADEPFMSAKPSGWTYDKSADFLHKVASGEISPKTAAQKRFVDSVISSMKEEQQHAAEYEKLPPVTELHVNPFLNPKVVGSHLKNALSELNKMSVVDGLKRGFAAVSREGAAPSAAELSENVARTARVQDQFEYAMDEASKLFSKSGPADNIDFMQRHDTGKPPRTAELQAISDRIKQMFDQKVKDIRALGTGALEQVRENYFPHIWKKPGQVSEIIKTLSRRPMEGSKAFLRQRVFDDVQAGIDAGYEPVSHNPIDLAVLKMIEMDKYIITHKTFDALKDSGEVKFFRPSKKPGPEYERIDDKYATKWRPIKNEKGEVVGRTIAGNYYAKGPTAQVLNNYLSSNLYNNKYVGSLFKAYMGTANSLNQFQLGVFSAFHGGFTSLDTVLSMNALGLRQLSEGRFSAAAKSFTKAPFAWATTPYLGNKLIKEWLKPGSQGKEMADIIDGVVAAGGRKEALRGERFQTDATKKMVEAWHRGTVGGKAAAVLRSPFALVEQSARPIQEYLVPRQKFGVFGELMNYWLKQHPNAPHEEMRTAARQFWNRVDSRLGQVVYDRIFANNVAKNVTQALFRAPGWTGGTILEVGGGGIDAVKFAGDILEGKKPVMTDRMAYTLSLLMTTAIINGALTYAFTGQKPSDKDFWAFRTGRKKPDGSDERFMLPTYAKDLFAYKEAPLTTLVNKTHPLLSMSLDVVRNKDYYGNQVRDEDANYLKQLAQTGGYAVKQYEPFWMRGAQKATEQGKSAGSVVAPLVGVMPAPKSVTQSAAEKLASNYVRANLPSGAKTEEQQLSATAKRDIRVGQPGWEDRASDAFEKGDITKTQFKNMLRDADKKPLERMVRNLTVTQAQKVYAAATPEEKALLEDAMTKKLARERKNRPFKVEDTLDEDTLQKLVGWDWSHI